ncbi:MAG: VCBS repeat-containing protein [Bdellovibrionales bacterium]|nr:VCBS repeat-containing protein [Bdellovibrionales bacterium]
MNRKTVLAIILLFGSSCTLSMRHSARKSLTDPLLPFSFLTSVTHVDIAGNTPRHVIAVDLNHDGLPDLVGADSGGATTRIRLAVGDGTFVAMPNVNVGGANWLVAVADLNGDSHPDLTAISDVTDGVAVALGAGDGTFAASTVYPTGSDPGDIALTDLNGDSRPDIIVLNRDIAATAIPDTVSVLINSGTGTFAAQVPYTISNAPVSMQVADFDGDSITDIVVNAGNTDIDFLKGVGNGTFAAKVTSTSVIFTGGHMVSLDIDGDGDRDIVTVHSFSDFIGYSLNNGNGTFANHVQIVTSYADATSLFTGDFNFDGRADLGIVRGVASNDQLDFFAGQTTAPYFVFDRTYSLGTDQTTEVSANTDIDGDGFVDVIGVSLNTDDALILYSSQ